MKMKKIAALVMATMMVFGASTIALADEVETQEETQASTSSTHEETDGKITILNASKGVKYAAYKVLNATYNETTGAIAYTAIEGVNYAESGITFEAKTGAVTAVDTDTLEAWVLKQNFDPAAEPITATSNTVVFDNLPYGYYYVTSSLGTTISIDYNAPSAEIYDKNTTETTDAQKKIVITDGTVDKTSAAFGETVTFEVSFDAVNYSNGNLVTEYTITDTATGLTLDLENAIITVDSNITLVKDADWTVTDNVITIPWVDNENVSKFNNNVKVVITYDATVNENDDGYGVSTNAVEVYDGTKTSDDVVEVYTYELVIDKYDATNKNQKLAGAEFELSGDNLATAISATTNEDGKIEFEGLKAGTYVLTETKAPDGYNKLADPIEIVIGEDDNGALVLTTQTQTQEVSNQSGTELPSTGGIGTTIFYVVGGILVLGAGVVLVAKKRMNHEA